MDASAEVLTSGSPLGPGDPTVLGSYTMLRSLGEGGMGAVYLARGPGDRLVAIKVIRPEYAQIDEFRVRFRRETDNARRVARFCTAEVLDADPDGEKPYLVTEFVEGATLSRVVASSGPLSAANLERLAVGMAAALSAIHGAGIVHRDLKPGNVMLSPYGPRVIDFGIARAADAAIGLTEVRIGTPAFMAPEQVLGDQLTGAVDIFAWGAVVAYASSGNYPFGSSNDAQFYRIVQSAPDLTGLDQDGFLRPIVERAMNKNPSARPSATELLLSLLSNTHASAPDDPEAAVTQALTGWSPQRPDQGPGTQVTAQTPWYTERGGAGTQSGAGPDGSVDPYAVTDMAGQPPGPPVAPPTGPQPDRQGGTGRQPTGPPVRPTDEVPVTETGAPGGGPRRGRLIAAVAAAVVVLAAAIFGLTQLGGDSKSGGGKAGGAKGAKSTPKSVTTSTSPSVPATTRAVAFPIPRSAQPLSADTIAFTVVQGSNHSLYTMRSDGSGVHAVGSGSPRDLPAISPDRRSIAFFVYGEKTLWIMTANGAGTRSMLTGSATVLKPYSGDRTAWSPDGKSVCFVASGPNGDGLYVVQLETGAFRKLPTQTDVGQPSWSPKGDQIVYWSRTAVDGGPLYTIAADGKSPPHQLTNEVDLEPVWSPDASHITFEHRSSSTGQDIWTIAANGTGKTNLTAGAGKHNDMNPSYSPTGSVVFSSDRSGQFRLYVTDPRQAGGVATLIRGQTLAAVNPSWSQDP